MITINKESCKRCHTCMVACPVGLIYHEDPEGYPEINEEYAKGCVLCGHCVAVCPHEAVALSELPHHSFVALKKELQITDEEALQFLKSRRSVRAYKDKPVPREILNKLMDATRWASSANHRQPIKWIFIQSPTETRKMAGLVVDWMRDKKRDPEMIEAWERGEDMVLRGAPHLAIACIEADRYWGFAESAIAMTYLELAAPALGLGSCWAGYFTRAGEEFAPIKKALGIDESIRVCGAMMIGYPKYHFVKIPGRKELDIKWV